MKVVEPLVQAVLLQSLSNCALAMRYAPVKVIIIGTPSLLGSPYFIMGRDPVELAKRTKYKPPAR